MITCRYCPRPSFTAGWTNPELCEAHLELSVVRANFNRRGLHFSLRNVQQDYQLKAREGYTWSFRIDQIPDLMNQMLIEDYWPALTEAPALETA